MEMNRADAGRNCRTRLARPFSGANAHREICIFLVQQDHERGWQPFPVGPYSCYMCDHTYMHAYIIQYQVGITKDTQAQQRAVEWSRSNGGT